jgi:voltage-gated potassium channel
MATSMATSTPTALQRRVHGLLDGHPEAGDPLDVACYVILLALIVGAVAFVLLLGSTLMYFAERDAQPEKFGSIPEAMWWGVATITTVGYGDVYPVTALGRTLGGLLAVLGIASFALPTAILGAAFLDELLRARTVDGHARCPTCGQPWHDSGAPPG